MDLDIPTTVIHHLFLKLEVKAVSRHLERMSVDVGIGIVVMCKICAWKTPSRELGIFYEQKGNSSL